MPCERRTVLSALAGGGVAALVGTSPGLASAPPAAPGGETAMNALDLVSRAGTPATLEGSVTTPSVSAGDRLLVGTDRGLYVFEDERLGGFVPTRPVRTIAPVGDHRAVVLVEDRFFPNVLAIDLAAAAIDWTASRTRSVFSKDYGRTDRQVPAFDAVGIGDATGNPGDVAVATGYGVAAFDGKTGEQRWAVDRDFYTWRLERLDGTVYATTQDGALLAIDAETGARRYAVTIADPFEGPDRTVPRSAWDVEAVDGGPGDLVVTTEAGSLAFVAADDGSVVRKTRVFEPDADDLESYYRRIDWRPTTAGGPDRSADPNYFNLELTTIDVGPPRFAVSVHDRSRTGSRENPGQVALVTAEGEVQWTNDSVDLASAGNVCFSEAVAPDGLFVPSPSGGGVQEVAKLGLESGREENVLSIPAAPPGSRRRRQEGVGYLGTHGGDLVVTSETGDLSVVDGSGEIAWSFPAVRDGAVLEADFTGDGTDDFLVYSRNRLDRRRGVESRSLVVRSGTDGSVAWSRTVAADRFHEVGGLRSLRPVDRDGSGGEGGVDLLGIEGRPDQGNRDRIRELEREIARQEREIRALEREERNRDVDNSKEIRELNDEIQKLLAEIDELGGRPIADLVVLSGTDGTERRRIPLTISREKSRLDTRVVPTSVDTLGDGDGVAIVGGRQRILLVDLDAGEVTWSGPYRDEGLWPPIDSQSIRYVTVEGPGEVADIAAVAPNEPAVAIIETEIVGEDLHFELTGTVELDGGRVDPAAIRTLGDLDGDGRQELLCPVQDDETQALTVVSPGEAAVVKRFEGGNRIAPTVQETGAPSGDGDGLVAFTTDGDRFTVTVTDGVETAWTHRQDLEGRAPVDGTVRPAALAGDVDGDGVEEVAVATSAPDGGAKVDLYTVSTGDRVDSILLEAFDEHVDPDADPLTPVPAVQRLPDPGGGSPTIGVIADPTGEGDARLYVVDPAAGDVLVSGDAGDGTFVDLENAVGLLGRDAGLRSVDPSTGVTLEATSGGSTVDLSWGFDDGTDRVSTLSVNDRPVAITTDRSARIELPSGTHTVDIAATSPDGFTVYDSTTVSVGGSSSMGLLLYGAAGVSLLGLVAPGIVDSVKRRVRS